MIAAAALLLGAAGLPSTAIGMDSVDRLPAIAPHRVWATARASIWTVPCQDRRTGPGECGGLQLRRRGERQMLGQGYAGVSSATGLLWRRHAGVAGPDAVVFGFSGGNDACAELFAVTLATSGVRSQKLEPCHDPPAPVAVRRGRATVDLMFPAGGPAVGGSGGTTAGVFVPAVWRGGRFQADVAEMARRSRGPDDLAVRDAAVSASLENAHDQQRGEVSGDALRPAVQALFGLMLYGRADEARAMLHADWPATLVAVTPYATRPVPGEDAFWRLLCRSALRNPLWDEIDMDRVPHADLIRAGAGQG